MAGIDYNGIAASLQAALQADAALSQATVSIEDEVPGALDIGPWVVIYLLRRDAPVGEQRLAAGTRLSYIAQYVVYCWQYSLESEVRAVELRNDLLSAVEVALLRKQKTLGAGVEFVTLEGGGVVSLRQDAKFISGGELIVNCRVAATI